MLIITNVKNDHKSFNVFANLFVLIFKCVYILLEHYKFYFIMYLLPKTQTET